MRIATIRAVREETIRAQKKHPNSGVETATLDRNGNILSEETGEVAQAAMNLANAVANDPDNLEAHLILEQHLYDELTQVASVATRWMETL